MNRRDFLKAFVALSASTVIPVELQALESSYRIEDGHVHVGGRIIQFGYSDTGNITFPINYNDVHSMIVTGEDETVILENIADQAQIQNELAEEHNLQYRKPVPSIAPNGCCHNPVCDAPPFEDGSLKKFCNDRCAKEYERYNNK